MGRNQLVLGLVWTQKIMVTQYQPRAMTFVLAWENLISLISHCLLWTSSEFSSRKPSGVFRLLTSSAFSSRRPSKGFGAGYGPLQRSHQGDHNEIAGYGPLQSTHQWYRFLMNHWEAGIWSCDLRANKRPQKIKDVLPDGHIDIATTRPNRPTIWWKDVVLFNN